MSIKKKLSLKDLKNNWKKTTSESFSNNYYPFYSMDFDKKATIRFLPDLNDSNPLGFMLEKLSHKLTIKGEDKGKTVPCLKMYGEKCPICDKSAELYKNEGKETVQGKLLYRKKQHLAQVLVVEDPLKDSADEESAVGKVKLINLGYSLTTIINEAFNDDDLEEVPWDYTNGTDFIIKKTKKGDYANYELSKFQRNERSLGDNELAAVSDKLIDLSTLIPKAPTPEYLIELMEAHLNGTSIVPNNAAMENNQSNSMNSIDPGQNKSAPSYGDDSTPTDSTPTDSTPTDSTSSVANDDFDQGADNILAQLKANRQNQQSN